MLTGKNEYRINIISTSNPINIKIPLNNAGDKIKKRNKITLEIESFHWMGSFHKNAVGTGTAADVENVPPHFFFFQASTSNLVKGIASETGVSSKILDFAYPKAVYDVVPTTIPSTERIGGTTIDDYGGISYDFIKVGYGIIENVQEKIDISDVFQDNVTLEIRSQHGYIEGEFTKTKDGLFKFENRNVQGLNNLSEPYVLRVLIVDE